MKPAILTATLALLAVSCGTSSQIRHLVREAVRPAIAIADLPSAGDLEEDVHLSDTSQSEPVEKEDFLIMKAIRDENGEMVATDVIRAATVTARFKNVAERHGKVELAFDLHVPREMLDQDWQLRLHPYLILQDERREMEPVYLTGKNYRKRQLRGYEQYERFLRSLTADSSHFVQTSQLEHFLERNLPQIWEFRKDSSFVSEECFASRFGVTEQDAIRHYTNQYRVRRNASRLARKEEMFRKYVRTPLTSDGLRLDTVLRTGNGDWTYRYVQSLHTRPGLKKASIVLTGSIFQEDREIHALPESGPLAFYISSLSTFADRRPHFLDEVLFRKAEMSTLCYIDFEPARHRIDPLLGNNPGELGRIENHLRGIVRNGKYAMDSILITASCSPEGRFSYNRTLSEERARSAARYFDGKMNYFRDSAAAATGPLYHLSPEEDRTAAPPVTRYRSIPENWELLDRMVRADTTLTQEEKDCYFRQTREGSPDLKEERLQKQTFYPYLRQHLYPRVRTVHFEFHLHRKGMVKDTVHTTRLDTLYMRGVDYLADRDYEHALQILRPYRDFNTALAYSALDYNSSAIELLEDLPPDDKVSYLLALLYSRKGWDRKAVRSYLEACRKNPQMISRGNLDPEISSLVQKYNLKHN